jgi:hypothetical protein
MKKTEMLKESCRKCKRNFHAKKGSDMQVSKLCAGCHRKERQY